MLGPCEINFVRCAAASSPRVAGAEKFEIAKFFSVNSCDSSGKADDPVSPLDSSSMLPA